MDTDKRKTVKLLEEESTEKILGAAFTIHNSLGYGFLEKVYANALAVELKNRNIPFQQQSSLKVKYKGLIVGDYHADIVVNNRVILELKAVSKLDSVHNAQLLNYLKATGIRVGLLLNIGRPKLQYHRLVK